MTGVISALAGGGAPNFLGSATVTVGTFSLPPVLRYGAEPYDVSYPYGAIAPTKWADSGLIINGLYHTYNGTAYAVVMRVTGYAPNFGWNTLTINGTAYLRVNASYSYDGTQSIWNWATTSTNPFGTTINATRAVSWS